MFTNRRASRRAKALARKGILASTTLRVAQSAIAPPSLPQWRMALLGSTAFVIVSLADGEAVAQCVPLTAGADNVTCAGALDGTLSDALAGNDTITVNTDIGVSAGATVSGGADDDTFALTAGDDLGVNAGGAGQLLGDAGADTITLDHSYVGYRGAGTVSGGADNDSIALTSSSTLGYNSGATGRILGDAGADTITLNNSDVGYFGHGTVSGGADNDSIALTNRSTLGFDDRASGQILGDAGADTITLNRSYVGYDGDGRVSGGADNDSIALTNFSSLGYTAGATGRILGDAGADTITLVYSFVGNSGDGTVSGGADNDSIALTNYSSLGFFNGGTGQILGDAGADTITLDNSFVGYSGAGTVDGGADNDSIALTNFSSLGYYAGATGQILGDAGADTITLDNSFVGYFGHGTVSGGADNDSIALTNRSTLGFFNGGTGQILGDAGADTITLNRGFVGYYGAGTVSGGADNDSIALTNFSNLGRYAGATGQILGDAGADTITLDRSVVGFVGGGTVSGGADNDSIALSNDSSLGRYAGGTGQILGDAGADTITLNASFVGYYGAGTVSGGADNDSIALTIFSSLGYHAGATGQILGDAGDDTITLDRSYVGTSGAGTVSGGADNDSIALTNFSNLGRYAGATGQILGDAGADTITLDRSLVGYYGAGTVDGGADNDSIALSNGSRLGNNAGATGQILGDAGADTITLDRSAVGTSGAGTVSGGADNDSIALSKLSYIGYNTGSTGQVLGDAGADTITLNKSFVGDSGAGTVSGGTENDSIALSTSSIGNHVSGTGMVLGDAGVDTITLVNSYVGFAGAGTVSGGADNDSIALSNLSYVGRNAGSTGQVLGDAGADTITLDNFSDVGLFGAGTVSGGADNDSIALTGGSYIGRFGGSTGQVLGDAGNDTITIDNSSIGNAGAGTVDGGANNDSIALSNGTIVGAMGQVLGGAGDDTVAIDQTMVRDAASIIDGGAGVDEVAFNVTTAATTLPGDFLNFESLRKDGAGMLTFTSIADFINSTTVTDGLLDLVGAGSLTSATVTVDGGELQTDGGGLAAGADVTVAGGGLFDVNGDETVGSIVNSGMIDIADATTLTTGTTANNAGGTITLGAGATLQGIGNTLNNAATINVAANGSLVDAGDINNLATGVINFNGPGGTLSSAGPNGVVNNGVLNLLGGDLAITGDVSNTGVISLADASLQTVNITGDFTQAPGGVLSVNVIGDQSDVLNVSGDVNIAGELNFASVAGMQSGTTSITIIDGAGALNGAFDVVSGLLINQSIVLDNANSDVLLNVTINPINTLTTLNANQTNVGENLFDLIEDPNLDPDLAALVFAIGTLPTEAEIVAVLNELHPEALDAALKFLNVSQEDFINMIISQSGSSGGGGPVQIASLDGGPVSRSSDRDGPIVWGAFQAAGYDQGDDALNVGFDGRSFDFMAGVSAIGNGPVTFGIAGGYSDFSSEQDGALGDEVDASVYRVGLSVRAEINGAAKTGILGHVDSVVSYADGNTDFVINQIDPATSATIPQRGESDISSVDWMTRLTIDGKDGRAWPLKPHLQVGVSGYKQSQTNVGTTGATALVVDELNNTRAQIGVGASFEHKWNDNMSMHARVTGVHYFGDTQNVFSSRFAAAPAGAAAFQTFGHEVKRQVELETGVTYEHDSGVALSIGAFGEVGDLNIYGGRAIISKRF